jgi:proteasome lid subunit RPN8/RPN11
MVAQAVAELPNECCGLLAGTLGTSGADTATRTVATVVQRYPLVNAAASPVTFDAEPRDLFKAFRDMRERGLDNLAIYHSHPETEPVPSRKDLQLNNYGTAVVNLIISLKGATPLVRGWWLSDASYREAEWICKSMK